MQLPRPKTYIKIKDVEQLKLLCKYKNDEVRHYKDYTIEEEIEYFRDGHFKYFIWFEYWKGTVSNYIGEWYTELTDDSFLYSNKKPKKDKQEVFVNKYFVGQKVFFEYYWKIKTSEIEVIKNNLYILKVEWNEILKVEWELYKTKKALIKSLSKQWRDEVEERILELTK